MSMNSTPTNYRHVLCLLLLLAAPVWAVERQQLMGHVSGATIHLQPIGQLPNSQLLDLAVGLPLRNPRALTALLEQLYDPASPQYRHYLTPDEFAEQFGPAKADYEALIS